MLFHTRIQLGSAERAIVARDGRFVRVLEPGLTRLCGLGFDVQICDVRCPLRGRWAERLPRERPDVVARYFHRVAGDPFEVLYIYVNGVLDRVEVPGRQVLYWKGLVQVTSQAVDLIERPRKRRAAALAA
ncbi:MAG: hypothetical protein FJW40_08565 [Acidobacteria bacterium]|nr:hypothetical protein [Acidobacteriota bacterium]